MTDKSVTTPEQGWVIEHYTSPAFAPKYWGGNEEWTTDNLKAVRFNREQDAKSVSRFLEHLEDETHTHWVRFHEWG